MNNTASSANCRWLQLNACSREWEALQEAISTLDVLSSFAAFSAAAEGPTCRATFVPHGALRYCRHATTALTKLLAYYSLASLAQWLQTAYGWQVIC